MDLLGVIREQNTRCGSYCGSAGPGECLADEKHPIIVIFEARRAEKNRLRRTVEPGQRKGGELGECSWMGTSQFDMGASKMGENEREATIETGQKCQTGYRRTSCRSGIIIGR